MERTKRATRRVLRVESLSNRELMAADLVNVGAFCTEIDTRAQVVASASIAAPQIKPTYTYTVVGDPLDKAVKATPGLALLGGGIDVDAAFAWMGNHANGGDFVVLSTSKNSYPKYINSLAPLNSVASLVVPDKGAANDSFVAQIVSSAEAVFIAGGDQADYITNWAGTQLETAIYTMLSRGGVLGGTSAGLAVLGDVDYAALNDATTSADALANPLTPSITLSDSFITPDEIAGTPLKYLQETITDSHFMQRDRMGRTLAFLARADYEDKVDASARGIAINEQTALLIEDSGDAYIVGNPYAKKGTHYDQQRSVYLVQPTVKASLSAGLPLTFQAQVQRLNYDPISGERDSINFVTGVSSGADLYTINAVAGVLNTGVPANPNLGVYGPAIA